MIVKAIPDATARKSSSIPKGEPEMVKSSLIITTSTPTKETLMPMAFTRENFSLRKYTAAIGVNKGISILELAELIKEIAGYKGKITLDKSKPEGVSRKTLDNTRLKAIFNWSPGTSLREGINTTVEWYTNNIK